MTFSNIKLVTFDADDTLWDFNTMMVRGTEAVAQAIHARFNGQFAHLTAAVITQAQHHYIEKQDPQTIDYLEARRVVFRQLFERANYPHARQIANELTDLYVAARNERYEFFEDAHTTLAALKGRYKLGYLTNGTTHPDEVGLSEYFDVLVLPTTLNLRKPKPEVFLHAAELAGCEIGQMLHVGDNLVSDVGGAIWAGAHGVWFNPFGLTNDTKIKPSAEISQLGQVIGLLG